MLALLELQRAFAAALRDEPQAADAWANGDGISATARLRVYRNNARAVFERALEATYPVVRERVGPEFFRQLAHFYRPAHPSTNGDLHEVGRYFGDFLRLHLAEGHYEWLAELAALEWAIAEAGVAADSDIATASALGGLAPEAVAGVRLRFAASLRCPSARVPVLAVWRANQPGAGSAQIDLGAGPQYVLVHRAAEGVQLRELQAGEFAFVTALGHGATLESAVETSGLALEQLPGVLLTLFTDGIVADVIPPGHAALPERLPLQ
jgi:hypothetical protein